MTEIATELCGAWDCTNEQYHADASHLNASALKLFRRSPAKYHRRYVQGLDQKQPTDSMVLGSLVHALVLEPSSVDSLFAVAPKCDRRTTVGKAQWAEFVIWSAGKQAVAEDVFATAQNIAAAVRGDTFAKMLLGLDGVAERAIRWTDEATGTPCKAKPDFASESSGTLIDLKTCQDASLAGFSRQMAAFEYHCQAAWYCAGWEALTGTRPAFVFIAVETDPPYEVACHEIDENSLALGHDMNMRALRELAQCRATDQWEPAWRQQINVLSLPAWAFRRDYDLSPTQPERNEP